ncbi:heme peroxidase [Suillus plorans]|uniref:Peroxidase n=1 Tax=Suillus plorans TaxID=116603 RepID=A0A9P7DEV8_9AGAM|nr:heme peroxidase [Suillus plorans]KAG1790070.1 heme peroxidase [Suillus plorans]
MSFAAIRAPLRRQALSASFKRPQLRTSSFRKYSTEAPPAAKSNTGLYVGLGAVVLGGGVAYYLYDSSSETAKVTSSALKSAAQSAKVATNFVPTKEDYQKVYNRIAEVIDDADDYDNGSFGPVVVRLAWHASGTYDKATGTGGSNYATMRFQPESLHGANAGLHVAREVLEKIKQEFSWISYGDLWTLAGVAAVQEMAGPKVPWRPGRIDGFESHVPPDGRLPDASQGAPHIRDIFYRMGFDDQEIVALCGAHALGRCHTDRYSLRCIFLSVTDSILPSSGYDGPWTFSPTTFTNDFYKLLFDEKWVWKKWNGPKQLEDKKTKSLMMLPYVALSMHRQHWLKVFQNGLRSYTGQEFQEVRKGLR